MGGAEEALGLTVLVLFGKAGGSTCLALALIFKEVLPADLLHVLALFHFEKCLSSYMPIILLDFWLCRLLDTVKVVDSEIFHVNEKTSIRDMC